MRNEKRRSGSEELSFDNPEESNDRSHRKKPSGEERCADSRKMASRSFSALQMITLWVLQDESGKLHRKLWLTYSSANTKEKYVCLSLKCCRSFVCVFPKWGGPGRGKLAEERNLGAWEGGEEGSGCSREKWKAKCNKEAVAQRDGLSQLSPSSNKLKKQY